MKRLIPIFLVLPVLAVCLILWLGHRPRPPSGAANAGPRALTAADQKFLVPLICPDPQTPSGASPAGASYQYRCSSLTGYPDAADLDAGPQIAFTSIVTGHLTDETSDEAYISYQGSFESHADNFGGGILVRRARGAWHLVGWYPGGALQNCLLLEKSGRARFLCRDSFSSQGETDTSLWVTAIAPYGPNAGLSLTALLKASDARGTISPNANCDARKAPDQAILFGITALRPAAQQGVAATATISYISAPQAAAACAAHDLAAAPPRNATLEIAWNGQSARLSPKMNFAPVSW